MTAVSPYLGIPQVSPSQSDKEVSINNAVAALEAGLGCNNYGVVFTGTDYTLANAELAGSVYFVCSGNTTALNLILPATTDAGNSWKKMIVIKNAGSAAVTVKAVSGGATKVVASAATDLLFWDGTGVTPIISSAVNNGIIVNQGTTLVDGAALTFTFDDALFTVIDVATGSVKISAAGGIVPATPGIVYSTGTILAHTTLSGDFSFSGGTLSLTGVEYTANKNQPSGYAGLDSGGRVALAQLPTSLSEAVYFAGTLNASTMAVTGGGTLTSGSGTPGAMYKVTTAGTVTLDGISEWNIGDQAIFNGVTSTWNKVDGINQEIILDGSGYIPFSYCQPELVMMPETVQVFGKPGPSEPLGLQAVTQKLLIPNNMQGIKVVFRNNELPTSDMVLPFYVGHSGAFTTAGTITITSAGSISCSGMSGDVTLDPSGSNSSWALDNQTVPDATASNFAVTFPFKRIAG